MVYAKYLDRFSIDNKDLDDREEGKEMEYATIKTKRTLF
jgi:hypothetical protein